MRDWCFTGTLPHTRYLKHAKEYHTPLTCAPILWNRAWDFVCPVVPALQETLNCEQLSLDLLLEDDNGVKYVKDMINQNINVIFWGTKLITTV
jgi:hypothetical protein